MNKNVFDEIFKKKKKLGEILYSRFTKLLTNIRNTFGTSMHECIIIISKKISNFPIKIKLIAIYVGTRI